MNYSERMTYEDNGRLDGSYRIFCDIQEASKLGTPGHILYKIYKERFECLKESRRLCHDPKVQDQIGGYILKIENWFKRE